MQYRIYSDLNPPSTTVLEGFKGATFMEKPGYVFAPYVPMQVTPVISSAICKAKLAGLKVAPVFFSKKGLRHVSKPVGEVNK